MSWRRLVLQTGIGTDLRGRDYNRAAERAVRDALHRNSMTIPRALGYPPEAMRVEIDVGVARPEAVDTAAIAALVPYGQPIVRAVAGGLDVPADAGDGVTVIASAAVVALLDVDIEGGDAGVAGGDEAAGKPASASPAAADGDGMAGEAASTSRAVANDEGESGASDDGSRGPARLILESGHGVDLHGEDYTKAARRGAFDALHRSSLVLFASLGLDPAALRVEVRVGAQRPEAVDRAAVAAEAPHGEVTVRVERGGLDVVDGRRGTRTVIAAVAVVARLELPSGRMANGRFALPAPKSG